MTSHQLARILLSQPDMRIVISPEGEQGPHEIREFKNGKIGNAENWAEPGQPDDWHMGDPQDCVILHTEWNDRKLFTEK